MMWLRFAEYSDYARQRRVRPGPHIERFDNEPGGIDPDHRTRVRRQAAHRPRDSDRAGGAAELDTDVARRRHDGCGSDRQRDELSEFALDAPATSIGDGLVTPSMHQVGIDAVRERNAHDRCPRLGTRFKDLRL